MKQEELQQEFEKACEKMEITPSIPNVEGIPTEYQQQVIEHYMTMVINNYLINY